MGLVTRALKLLERKAQNKEVQKVIPVVDLKGVIKSGGGGGLMGGGGKSINIDAMRDTLKKAFNTAGAVAVALDINSPGGSPAQSELVANLIRKLAEEKHIPVYAFAQDVAASGGYWLACAADEIYSAKTSTLGSIGVVTEGYGYEKLFKKLGLEIRQFTAGKSKRRMNPAEPVKPEDKEWIQERLGKIHRLFKDWILERRGDRFVIPAGQDKENYLDENIFTGDTWNGVESVGLGLIDGIGDIETVLKEKFGEAVKIRYPETRSPKLLSLLSPFRSAVSGNAQADMVEAAVEAIADEITWSPYRMR